MVKLGRKNLTWLQALLAWSSPKVRKESLSGEMPQHFFRRRLWG